MVRQPTCDHCGDVIGVYEPMIVLVRAEPRETSRAAEPSVASEVDEHYHRSCYLERSSQRA